MPRKLQRNLMFILWLSLLFVAAVMLFLRGFLLTRVAFTAKNNCQYANTYDAIKSNCKSNDPRCWLRYLNGSFCLPHSRHRAVVLLIDALRYDFAVFNSSKRLVRAFENKLPIIDEMLRTRPKHSRLFRFVADPPSTTMQRIKALTTGTLPTFIDAGSNFASSEILEDNLIDQLERSKRRIVFLGDDTWMSLYPRNFQRPQPFPSFDVWDLDTVDTGIKLHLYPELQKSDWHLLIAHFLGVDHVGHRYEPNHPEMARKLSEMNHVIRSVIQMLPDDVVLYVIGDHGMTRTGDHGGFTDDEITAALFVYSPTQLIETSRKTGAAIKQINLVPTLASLLAVPIPFSNLGHLVPDLLPLNLHLNYDRNFVRTLKLLLLTNVQQIAGYLRNYSSYNRYDFSREKMQQFDRLFETLKTHRFLSGGSGDDDGDDRNNRFVDFESYVNASERWQRAILSVCEQIWVQFDSGAMARGLIMMLTLLLVFVAVVVEMSPAQFDRVFSLRFLNAVFMLVLFVCVALAALSFAVRFKLEQHAYFAFLFISIFFLLLILPKKLMQSSSSLHQSKSLWRLLNERYQRLKWSPSSLQSSSVVYTLLVIGLDSVQFSDNGVIHEGFLAVTCLLVCLTFTWYTNMPRTRNKSIQLRTLAWNLSLIAIVYVSTFFHACREETMHSCTNSIKNGIYEQLSCIISIVCVWLLVTIIKRWLTKNGSLSEINWRTYIIRYFPTCLVLACSCIWVFEKFADNRNLTLKRQTNFFAYFAIGLITIGCTALVHNPVFLSTTTTTTLAATTARIQSTRRKPQPQQFWRNGTGNGRVAVPPLPSWHDHNYTNGHQSQQIVYGWTNCYSSGLIAFAMFVVLLMVMFTGELLVPAVILMCLASGLFLFSMALARFERIGHLDELYHVPNAYIILWFMMSVMFFFGTNHQTTFPNIHWSAAFVGDLHQIDTRLAAVAVLLTTYSSYIFFALMLPLVFLAPFLFQGMCANTFHVRHAPHLVASNGELALIEQKDGVHSAILQLFTKYCLLHATRVFFVMLNSTVNCRHLLVWSIFAPKFIFEAVGLLVTLFTLLFSYMFIVRVQTAIDRFVANRNMSAINKQ